MNIGSLSGVWWTYYTVVSNSNENTILQQVNKHSEEFCGCVFFDFWPILIRFEDEQQQQQNGY